jgi:hypothetical protein
MCDETNKLFYPTIIQIPTGLSQSVVDMRNTGIETDVLGKLRS